MPEQAREVLAYFARNPQAADSLEGIARWRLLEETIRERVEEIERALSWLVAEGFLQQEAAAGAAPVFRLNRARAADAARLLSDRIPRAPGSRRRAKRRTGHGQR